MNPRVTPCAVPPGTLISAHVEGAQFVDSQRTFTRESDRTALSHLLHIMAATPGWIDALMTTRNRVVKLLGLKDLGRLGHIDLNREESTYQVHDQLGIFTLLANTPNEVLVADKDKHLDVYVSLSRSDVQADGTREIVVATVVHTHNRLGRLYMLPVAPVHRYIAPLMLARIPG